MTVSSVIPVNNYTGNSSNTKFDFDFLIENSNELVVQHTAANGLITILTEGTDYSINEIGNKEGSYITFPLNGSTYGVLSSEETISLMLDLTIKQESQFGNSLYFDLNILERTFDYVVRILQIFSRKLERCIKVNEGSELTPGQLFESIKNSEISSASSASSAATCANNASASATLAQAWATKTDGKVDGNEYSAKYYADLAHHNYSVSYEQMRSANAYLNEGEILSDVEGYKYVYNMAHSTYDSSKATVTGTPTISDDGIVSNFSASNYLTKSMKISGKWGIRFKIKITSFADFNTILLKNTTNRIFINKEGRLNIFLNSGSIALTFFSDSSLALNTEYIIGLAFDGVNRYTASYINMTTGQTYSQSITNSARIIGTQETWYIGSDTGERYIRGTFDLKYFELKTETDNYNFNKTGVDSYTISGSALFVPYTESITGSKIVDAAYCDRVESVYAYQGFAPYFTIDEENETFTLPMGEINGSTDKKIEKLETATNSALALKLNKTLTDITSTGKAAIVDCLMPDSGNTVTLLSGQNGTGTFTCPDNGYILYVGLSGYANANGFIKVNNALIANISGATGMQAGNGIYIVAKNDIVDYSVTYNYLPDNIAIYFVPMKGV